MTTYRRKIEEYEADLYKPGSSGWLGLFMRSKGGEMEVKRYDDGEARMEIDLHGLKCPDGALVSALVDGREVQQVEIRRGYARVRLSSLQGATIPQVRAGSTAVIRYQDETLLEGSFKPD